MRIEGNECALTNDFTTAGYAQLWIASPSNWQDCMQAERCENLKDGRSSKLEAKTFIQFLYEVGIGNYVTHS
jgi:hypothetical protein